MSSSSAPSVPYPRAAVAVTLRAQNPNNNGTYHYLLIQRANPPDQGKWALPGGKIDVGESTLEAAQRELTEETLIVANECQWYPHPFLTTDAIFRNDDTSYAFHYLIAYCFAQINKNGSLPTVKPSDDALDAQWWTLNEIMQQQHDDTISQGVVEVIQRAEELHKKGALL
jgi:8-oxo-dGTP diphosphatase